MQQTNRIANTSNRQGGTGWLLRALTAIGGFMVYGGWAYWANSDSGSDKAIVAMVTQGNISLVLTFLLNLFIERLYQSLEHRNSSIVLSWMIASAAVISLSASINWLSGTPNIFLTILPGSLVGMVYIRIYIRIYVKTNLQILSVQQKTK